MKPLHLAAATLIGLGCSALSMSAAADEYCVPFENGGSICGVTSEKDSYSLFKGIEYATQKRWDPSTIVSNYDPKTPASEFGKSCIQMGYDSSKDPDQSEDCLFLNIWTPKTENVSKQGLPVMVFIHGGAFIAGKSNDMYPPEKNEFLLYDGATFAAEQDVILVTFNYRLGALGFMQLSFSDQGEVPVGGNYGLQDQMTALQWVQDNIKKFGGDPDKVTLFGESAGAMSAGLHLWGTSKTQDLFNAVIMESNPIGYRYRNNEDGAKQAKMFLGCLAAIKKKIKINMDCNLIWAEQSADLSDYTLDDISKAQTLYAKYNFSHLDLSGIVGLPGALPFTPIIDGKFLTQQPADQLRTGSTKPLIFGFNQNEGIYFAQKAEPLTKIIFYQNLVKNLFNCASVKDKDCTETILGTAEYSPKTVFTQEQRRGLANDKVTALSNLINDFAFSCANMDVKPKSDQTNIWAYFFNQPDQVQILPGSGSNACGPQNQWDNSCHAAELPFVFNSLPPATSDANQKLAMTMNTAWATFAKNFDTTGPGQDWKKWQAPSASSQELPLLNILNDNDSPLSENIFETRNCKNWLGQWRPRTLDYNAAMQVFRENIK
ncbi:Para-nitrobenzyl esterase [Pseudovibrio sp. Ad13]|uniref:carboxylesterase family protein n=1 Tax=Pseudovibrio sp. Ad13 TaxID=989396 RepID=UPI0007B18CB9|nr:carboxylesterase family protein [Pseudovibrio sp. Ad13]KZK86946.1 Para-nitrobenzyl esterase [Pseudovibrio sp. Ad13]